MNSRTQVCVLLAMATLTTGCFGCSLLDEDSWGENRVAQFAWDEGLLGCMFGCDAAEPMAARSVAMIMVVNEDELPLFTASSDNPEVLEFTQAEPGDSSIRAESHIAGSAKLVLSSVESGDVIDRFRIRVKDVSRIELDDSDLYTERLTIMAGGTKRVYLDLEDGSGNELVGVGGVDYTLTGGISEEHVTLWTAIEDLIISVLVGTVHEYVEVEALALGLGAISVQAPSGASLEIPAQVVDETAVTRIDLSLVEEATVGETATVDAHAWSGEERIWSPDCQWDLDPPDGAITIEGTGRYTLELQATSAASAIVTCTIGAASSTLTVTFD